MRVRKAGKQTVTRCGGYEETRAPLCVDAKAVYGGKSFLIHRLKSKVTCKRCLRKLTKT